MVKDREELGNVQLWEVMFLHENLIGERFGLGLVGVGALFFAYASAAADHLPHLPELIAFAGAGSSFILWMHISGAHKEAEAFRSVLSSRDWAFMDVVRQARTWRGKGRNVVLYWPVNRLMTYFTGLLTESWLVIIAWRWGIFGRFGISYGTLFCWHIVLLASIFGLFYLPRRIQDWRHTREVTKGKKGRTTGLPAYVKQ